MNNITVIVPNYNKALYIYDCIQSIKQQTLQMFNCIIIDDGSTDNSVEIIQSLIKNDNRFQLFCNSNHGLSYSRNFGILKSNTKFILPLDSDDYIASDYLERIIAHFNQQPDTTLFYGRWKFFGYNEKIMNEKLGNLHFSNYVTLLKSNSIHCCCAYKREDAINCGLYDENMQGYEDWEFLIRLLYKDKKVVYDPTISLYYRQIENNMSYNCHKSYNEKFKYIYKKHINKYQEIWK